MKNYKINLLQSALDNLEEIVLFISSDNKNRAISWKNELTKKINNLSLFLEMGTLVPDKQISSIGSRMFPVGNYIVFYVILNNKRRLPYCVYLMLKGTIHACLKNCQSNLEFWGRTEVL